MDALPSELLDHILSLISPYRDLQSSKLVCKKWHSAVCRVVRRKQCNLNAAIKNNDLKWEVGRWQTGMAYRHSHSACYYNEVMYVYGGFSMAATTFNDLSALDLTSRDWRRLISIGHIPSPKGAASLCAFEGKLILYGGCAPPSVMNPFHPLIVFDELHVFDIASNTWTRPTVKSSRPPTANHSATVHGQCMVTYGGLISQQGSRLHVSDALHCLDLVNMVWSMPQCCGSSPPPMFRHSQIYLDETHLLIIGGRDTTGDSRQNGCWLLTMGSLPWSWRQITEENPLWSPPKLGFHSVIRVADSLVAFNHVIRNLAKPSPDKHTIRLVAEENVNGRRGHFQRQRQPEPSHSKIGPSHLLPRCERRQMQLSLFDKYLKKYSVETPVPTEASSMKMYVADASGVVAEERITWQEPRYSPGAPSDRFLYSLVAGKAEFIMLGGLIVSGNEKGDIRWPETHNLVYARAPAFTL